MVPRLPLRLIAVAMVVTVFSAPIVAQDIDLKKFWEAVATGDLSTVQQAFKARIDPNTREPNGGTPLMAAAMFGQTRMVSFLIENKARLNIQNNQGSTALHMAAFFGHPKAVRLLLVGGAARDVRNDDGLTPLDSVSVPWNRTLEGVYAFFDTAIQMGLDIDRIREVRPEVIAILRTAN